jgi:uracil-DNA glycosylase family 4
LLDKIFQAVTVDTNRLCYVTNVVKRRPLNNRDPTVAEIAFYRGWLMEEIRLVNPAIIVLTVRNTREIIEHTRD